MAKRRKDGATADESDRGKKRTSVSVIGGAASGKTSSVKKSGGGRGGMDEFDSIFAEKKRTTKETKDRIAKDETEERERRKKMRAMREEEAVDEAVLRGGESVAASAGGSDAKAPATLHAKAKKFALQDDRSDACKLSSGGEKEWGSDGRGGVFNSEGYTGRRDETGNRVFKAHLFNSKGFGQSSDCPFDCDCCFI